MIAPNESFDPVAFRRCLHQYPELSHCEHRTAEMINQQLRQFGLTPRTGLGGHGTVVEFDSGKPGKTSLFRADFDALPIQEQADRPYASRQAGVMHACGHDGHTASLMAVAKHLSEHPPQSGRVLLLFQPAEETGAGAAAMLQDPWLAEQHIDSVFAYHNLPGYPLNTVLIKPNSFACASTGVTIELFGKTSHAAKPEDGLPPTAAMINTIELIQRLPLQFPEVFALTTVVHASLGETTNGEAAFGTAPGYAKVLATLRSDDSQTLVAMKSLIEQQISALCATEQLRSEISWQEWFNAAVNSQQHCQQVIEQARSLDLPVERLKEPMRWSEDMAEFLAQWPGALFCLGSGEHHPQLHNPDYDFPDTLIDTACNLFRALINDIHCGTHQAEHEGQ
ncbi:amidohydrolase (plasmid) [Photobacterium sp. DA100]|uniref:amidohydrolase n=1 Tax=Photobacterium sp. DA100 TaxID=3027472 RepID=UPI00247A2452|nr:amidohydrolase [Photobacterium sp. DA100]WEM44978.1 amidohydrolase [Photobacterium sp. DA100]